jgi:hypothetical protein
LLVGIAADYFLSTQASPSMGERDIELGRLHADATAVYGPQHYFQQVSELGVLLENTGNMVQKLKVNSSPSNFRASLAPQLNCSFRVLISLLQFVFSLPPAGSQS